MRVKHLESKAMRFKTVLLFPAPEGAENVARNGRSKYSFFGYFLGSSCR